MINLTISSQKIIPLWVPIEILELRCLRKNATELIKYVELLQTIIVCITYTSLAT